MFITLYKWALAFKPVDKIQPTLWSFKCQKQYFRAIMFCTVQGDI